MRFIGVQGKGCVEGLLRGRTAGTENTSGGLPLPGSPGHRQNRVRSSAGIEGSGTALAAARSVLVAGSRAVGPGPAGVLRADHVVIPLAGGRVRPRVAVRRRHGVVLQACARSEEVLLRVG